MNRAVSSPLKRAVSSAFNVICDWVLKFRAWNDKGVWVDNKHWND